MWNLRIHFYGVQGSGSIFPSREDRLATREVAELDLLAQVFEDLAARAGADGTLNASVEDILGGAPDRRTLRAYRDRFTLSEPRVFGGWTTCIRVETPDGDDIVFDCGSGFRVCAKDIMQKWADRDDGRDLYIFGSHSHFDHTEGFDQAVVCFDPRNRIHVCSHRQYLRALDRNLGIFSHHVDANLKGVQTPLSYELMPATFESVEIRDFEHEPPGDPADDPLVSRYHDLREPMHIGDTSVQAVELFHPAPCYGFRIERGGKSFVFCTDHELRHGPDPEDPLQVASLEAESRLKALSQDADVLYRDAQFFRVEYDGQMGIGSPYGVSRVDWGHSCVEDVMDMALECGVKRTLLGHHDPNRDWSERNWIDETLARRSEQAGVRFELAQSEVIIEL